MPRSTDGSPRAERHLQLEALAVARRHGAVYQAKTVRWFVAFGVLFVAAWSIVGYTIAAYAAAAVAILILALISSGKIVLRRSDAERQVSVMAGTIEMDVLQGVLDDVAPSMRISDRSPITAALVRDARVIPASVDSISGQRCLSGLHHGHIPFCAAFIEVTKIVEIRRRQMPVKRHYDTVFTGIVAVIDHPGTHGWMTLAPADSLRVGAMVEAVIFGADEYAIHVNHPELERLYTIRGSSAADADRMLTPELVADLLAFRVAHSDLSVTIGFRNDSIVVSIPMAVNPLTLKNNPDTWADELEHTAATARALRALFDVLRPPSPMRLLEAS